ncbi:MAG: ABC transporter permease [Thermotoga sp.]|nr:MAG: ABC transporter permease [Thermotoga sp.]
MKLRKQNEFINIFTRGSALSSLFAITIAIIIILIVLLPMGISPKKAFHYTIKGCFGSLYNISEVLVKTTPLLLAGTGVAIAFRAGLFNIGIEGQILIGGLMAAYSGFQWNLPPIIHLITILLIGGMCGGLWILVPAYLKVKKGINEVITTLLMYYISIYLTHYLVVGPWKAPGLTPATPYIKHNAIFPLIIPNTRLHGGIIFAITLVILIAWIFKKTRMGFEIKAVGLNPIAAEYAGIKVNKIIYLSLFLSGVLGGLTGAVEIAGIHHRFFDQFSSGMGFDGITVALVGKNNPIGIIFSAIFFALIRTTNLEMAVSAGVPKYLSFLMEGIIVILVAFENIYQEKISQIMRRHIGDMDTD